MTDVVATETESGNPEGMTETDMTEEVSAEMPDFDIYQEEESQVGTEVKAEESKPEEKDKTWTARVKKDREQRRREIDFKKREQSLADREGKLSVLNNIRDSLLADPNKFLEAQGIDPLDFYSDWTSRIASGNNIPSTGLRMSAQEKELKELKQELMQRDQNAQKSKLMDNYYGQIDSFKSNTEDYPLTQEQCTTQDIAEGIGAYYQKTGVELNFEEAFKMIEDGLRVKEDNIFNDPAVIAKFKKHHGLDASNKKGRRSQVTLSNNLETQPTKTPAEDMTDDEIHEFWKGKLFT